MRSLEQLTSHVSPREAELRARARAVLNAPNAANTAEELVAHLQARWAYPALFSERNEGTRPEAPQIPDSALSHAVMAEGHQVGERFTKLLSARALARALLSGRPSVQALERLPDLLHYAAWEEFVAATAAMAGDPKATEWVRAMRSPNHERYLAGALESERDGIRQASERWRGRPRVLGRPADRGHTPIGSAFSTALPVLRQLDTEAWFEALRQAPLRAEVERAVVAVARRPDNLLRMLERAPVALDSYGDETGHVAGILLAEKAWRYPVEVGRILESRVRAGTGAVRQQAEVDFAAFVASEIDPWLNRVWAVLQARPDGQELSLALAVKQLALRTRHRQGQPAGVVRKVENALENRVSPVFRPRLEVLARLLDGGDLGRHYGALERWRAFTRIACDDVGDIAEGAQAGWNRFVELLSESDDPEHLRSPESVNNETWDLAGFVLAQQPRPAEELSRVFDDLLLDRERARMGVRIHRNSSDLPLAPIRSRVLLYAGAHALAQRPVQAHPASLWRVAFAALREMWLGSASVPETLSLVRRTYLYGARAYIRLPSGDPAADAFYEELVDALRYLESDPCLSCEVAELWFGAGWPPAAVVTAFDQAGIDVRGVCSSLLSEPNPWRHGQTDLESLARRLG